MAITPLELVHVAALAADEKKAQDLVVLDLEDQSDMCDYFLICTASSKPQTDAILEAIEEKIRINAGESPLAVEGKAGSDWTLMDYGAVVIHVFRPAARDYFRIERLWGDAPRVDFGLESQMSSEPSGISEPSAVSETAIR